MRSAMIRLRPASAVVALAACLALSSPTPAAQDTTPPDASAVGFPPTTIDVTAAARVVTVTARLTDDLSGVSAGLVTFTSPSGAEVTAGFVKVSGNGKDGTYQSAVSFPQGSQGGVWRLSLRLQDGSKN